MKDLKVFTPFTVFEINEAFIKDNKDHTVSQRSKDSKLSIDGTMTTHVNLKNIKTSKFNVSEIKITLDKRRLKIVNVKIINFAKNIRISSGHLDRQVYGNQIE